MRRFSVIARVKELTNLCEMRFVNCNLGVLCWCSVVGVEEKKKKKD